MRSPASHCCHTAGSSKVDVPEPWCSGDITTLRAGLDSSEVEVGRRRERPLRHEELGHELDGVAGGPAGSAASDQPRLFWLAAMSGAGPPGPCAASERFDDEASNPILELFFEASNPRLNLPMARYGGRLYCLHCTFLLIY